MLRSGDPSRPLFVPWSSISRDQFALVTQAWTGLRQNWATRQPSHEEATREAARLVGLIDGFVAAIEAQMSRSTAILQGVQLAMMGCAIAGVVAMLYAGYLFVLSLIGVDPVPFRLPYPGRLVMLIGIMAMHAFFGIAIMMQSGLMVAEWFGAMGRTWGATPLEDQYIGGGAAWSIGEIPTLILAIVVAIQWSRNDDRAQRRRDRQVDRSGDSELDDYNARLATLAEQDTRAGR